MDKNKNRRSEQAEKEQQPGDLSSFNKRDVERSTESEGAETQKEEEHESRKENNINSDDAAR